MTSEPTRPARLIGMSFVLMLLFQLSAVATASAGSAGVLPFLSSKGVPNGAAENIASLVSTEVDIRGGYDLVLSAGPGEVKGGCGKSSACITAYGGKNSFQHVITGNVASAGRSRYSLTLTLYDVASGRAIRQVRETLDRDPDSLLDGIPDLVVELLTGKRPSREEQQPEAASGEQSTLFSDDDEFGDDSGDSGAGSGAGGGDKKRQEWLERDRHGRRTNPASAEEDPLGLDDFDLDLDLDELSSDRQKQKSKQRSEREESARVRRQEEERLAEIAAEEERRRKAERERREEEFRREEERQRRADKRDREEERLIQEERRRRREEELAREEDRQRDEERERRRVQKERERRRAEAEERNREEQREEAERQRYDERERRLARARLQEEAEEEERRRRRQRDRSDEEDDVTLDAGIIIIESEDDGDEGYEEVASTEQGEEDGDFGILIEEDSDEPEERSYGDRDERGSNEDRSSYRDDDERSRDTGYGRRGEEEQQRLSRRNRSYEDNDSEEELNLDRRHDDSRGSARSEYGRSSRSGSSSRVRTSGKRERPAGTIRASVGYNYFYLSFLKMGIEGSIYVLPNLSLDLGVEAWMLWLTEGEELSPAARVLPNFLVGASYRMNFHPVVRPFVGGDVGTVIYAQKVEVSDSGSERKVPLFSLTLAARGGSEFILSNWFGLYASARVGVSISGDLEQDGLADIQQYVNETWSPTRVFFNIGVGALVRF